MVDNNSGDKMDTNVGSLLVSISTTKILDVTNRTPPLRYSDSLQMVSKKNKILT